MRRPKFFLMLALATLLLVLSGMVPRSVIQVSTQDTNAYELVFTIPVGEDGIHYEGEGVPEMLTWGPTAFTVAPDGSFWIADTIGNRLLHYSSKGEFLSAINLSGLVVGIGDLEATPSDILVLDIAAVVPKIIRLSQGGQLLASYEIPEGLQIENGLSGIAIGDKGEILVEMEGGASVFQLVNAEGKLSPQSLGGYIHRGRLYKARPADLGAKDTSRGYIVAGNTRIEVIVAHDLAGLRFLGFNPDGSFHVIVEEMVSYPAIHVDQTIRHYNATGELLGLARVPLAEQYVYVPHGLALGPDGAVYALITRPRRVEVWRLRFVHTLKPILSAAYPKEIPQKGERQDSTIQSCRSRDLMMSVASGYTGNSKYLNSTNTDGYCPGRCKPRYIGGPGTYPSVPYDWGGWDPPGSYNSYMDNGKQAGDAPRSGCSATVESCSRGTDCSGFVSRAWGLSYKHSTCTLESVSCQLKGVSCLQKGDILVKCGVHTVLVKIRGTNGVYAYESTTYNAYDRVVYLFSYWSRFSGYTPRRYCNVCGPYTCIGYCIVSPSPCP